MNTHEDYVSFEQAKRLKELGFDWECNHHYDNEGDCLLNPGIMGNIYYNCNELDSIISAPTLAQAQKWLREAKQIIIIPCVAYREGIMKYDFYIVDEPIDLFDDSELFDTYEEALSAGIDKALELLKEQENGNQN